MSAHFGNTLGLDIGGTNLKSVLLSPENQVLKENKIPSGASVNPEAVREAIRLCVRSYQADGHTFDAIGIGCAGSVDFQEGVVRHSPNFAQWKDVPLKTWSEADFNLPTLVDNDANCATYTEWKLGKGKGCHSLVMLTLGTGVGGGVVLNGEMFRGSTGTGPELGHFAIHVNGIPCTCGHRGCLERYCSASALKRRFPQTSAKEIFQKHQESPYQEAVEEFVTYLSSALVSFGNTFDPEMIILGGAVAKGMTPHLPRLRKEMGERAFPAVGKNLKIELAQNDNWSGSIGSALLARQSQE